MWIFRFAPQAARRRHAGSRRAFGSAGAVLLMLLTAPADLAAGEATVAYGAIERALWASMMTEDGRHYIEGGPAETCRFAFLQEPRVDATEGRLRIRFVFSGRAGVEVKDRCLGAGDTFDLVATGTPTVSEGELRLADLQIAAPDTSYFRLVSGLVESRLRDKLRYPLARELQRAVAASATGLFRLALTELRVAEVRAGPDALRLDFSADLAIR